jgi:hypothetical protein
MALVAAQDAGMQRERVELIPSLLPQDARFFSKGFLLRKDKKLQ